MGFRHMKPDDPMWDNLSKKFSKKEITQMLKDEKVKVELLLHVIEGHKLIIKQAKQRLDLSNMLEV